MRFKLIMDLVDDHHKENILNAARKAGATVVKSAHGEGITPEKTFLGLEIAGHRDHIKFLVKRRSREVLQTIAKAGEFDQKNLGAASHSKLRSKVLTEEIEEQL